MWEDQSVHIFVTKQQEHVHVAPIYIPRNANSK